MQTLSAEERQNLLEIINEDFGPDLSFDDFSEAVLGLFDDIPGFETIPPTKANRYVTNSGANIMVKNPAKQPDQSAAPAAKSVKVDLSKQGIQDAITEGKALIKDGKSKADAARAIYAKTKDEPKEVIVAAFVAGATLTEKGALTYWYNCKRKAAKAS